MRKFILSIVCFTVLAILTYLVLILVWGTFLPNALKPNLNYLQNTNGFLYKRLNEAKSTKHIDVVVFGSSHAYRGYDTRIFKQHNIGLMNMGSSMQTPIQTKTLIKRYLASTQPKLVVLDVYPYAFCLDGVESSVDLISNDKNDKYSLAMAFEINNIKTYNTLVLGFINDWLHLINKPIKSNIDSLDTYVSGGFVERQLMYYNPKEYDSFDWNYNDKQFIAFKEVLDILEMQNIDFILVYSPISKSLYNSVGNQDHFHARMNSYGNYYNFNELIELTDSLHFFDANHLNQKGVELYNEQLIELCISN